MLKIIEASIKKLSSSIFSEKVIINEIMQTLSSIYTDSSINIYTFDKETKKVHKTQANRKLWTLPEYKEKWFSSQPTAIYKPPFLYVKNRNKSVLTDFKQLKADQEHYKYSCNDGLFLIINTNSYLYSVIFIHTWDHKQPLKDIHHDLDSKIEATIRYFNKIIHALEYCLIDNKIKNLVNVKNKLTQKLQQDESKLKQRLLELTTLYDTSNEQSYSLDYSEIVKSVTKNINKVLKYDACCVFINKVFNKEELFLTLGCTVNTAITDFFIFSALDTINSFFASTIEKHSLTNHINYLKSTQSTPNILSLKSQATIPLIYHDTIIGIVIISAFKANRFKKNELQFLHTISNNMASSLGKLKIIKDLEKSKIYSILKSIHEPIIVIDIHTNTHITNKEAEDLLNISSCEKITKEKLIRLLDKLSLLKLFEKVKKTKEAIVNKSATFNNKVFSVNISPVFNSSQGFTGVVFLFKDITKLQQIDRIKSQRLKAISEVNTIIESIQKPNDLPEVLIEFLLTITNCSMGSIQLKQSNSFVTAAHKNFPEKIRRSYRFTNRETISEKVIKTKKHILITDYFSNSKLDTNVKVLIELYLCIPIIIKGELIGIINLLRKYSSASGPFTKEDLDTLLTITSIVATSIQNSILYEDKLEKEMIDQEIKVAKQIQNNLLPKSIPIKKKVLFGALNIPASKIGGDFFDFIELDDNKTGIIIADIVGKGIPAGIYMSVLKSILNRSMLKKESPKETMSNLNTVIINDPVINKFIPMFYGVIDTKNKVFIYSNAGHEPAFILRKNSFIKCDTKGLPLGSYHNESFIESVIDLEDNDIFFCFTDGITEVGNIKGYPFGLNGVQTFIKEYNQYPPQVILDKLKTHLNSYSTSYLKKDDITAVICQYNSTFKKEQCVLFEEKMSVTSSIKNINQIRQLVSLICKKACFNEKTIMDIKLSINEAHANIIEHAYQGISTKKINFKFIVYTNKLEAIITDKGLPFNTDSIEKRINHNIDELEGSGLGVFLIYTLMDEIKYEPNDSENKLTLVKYNIK